MEGRRDARHVDVTPGASVTDQLRKLPDDPRSAPEQEFLRQWRRMIDRVGGDGGQARAAKHLNWTTSTVSRDYKGDTLPTDERLHQLCSSLQLSPNETLDLAVLLRRARSGRRDRLRNPGAPAAPVPRTPAKNSPRASRRTTPARRNGAGFGAGGDG